MKKKHPGAGGAGARKVSSAETERDLPTPTADGRTLGFEAACAREPTRGTARQSHERLLAHVVSVLMAIRACPPPAERAHLLNELAYLGLDPESASRLVNSRRKAVPRWRP